MHTIYEFPGMIWSWNLHWRYPLIKKVGQGFYQFSHLTPGLVFKLHTILLRNSLRPNFNFIASLKNGISRKELRTRNNFQEKSCDHPDVIYRPNLSKSTFKVSNWYHVGKFVNCMYWGVTPCCADVSNFERRSVKVSIKPLIRVSKV